MYTQEKSTTILSELKHSFTNNITHWYINLISLKPYTITRYFLSFFILFVFLPQAIHAQEYKITGTVRDLITENGIDSARVELLREDSSLVAVTMSEIPVTEEESSNHVRIIHKVAKDGAAFTLNAPAPSRYIIRCRKMGYETTDYNIEINPDKIKGTTIDVGDIYMQEEFRKMGEVVVKRTMIRMFYKGDTLVYNANAFVLPDGSMLDDLVKQLPGAEIRDGNIYVNGRLVEDLLLGGKDFFNGNPQAALKNLPAYVVNRVKVYEKEGALSQTTGTDMGDKSYVMDVHLKRQYIGTYLGQVKAGYGTEKRYEGGLFAMRFDDRQSFTLSGDFNNLNTDNSYNRYGGFARTTPSGLHERNYVSADYRFEPSGKLKLTANAVFEHRSDRLTEGTASETFLSGGNTYGRSLTNSSGRSIGGSGNTKLTLRPRNGRLYEIGYSGGYRHQDHKDALRSASFSSLPETEDTENILDSVFLQPMNEELRKLTLNRLKNDASAEDNQAFHKLTAHSALAFQGNLLDISGDFRHNKRAKENFDIYRLEYPKTGQAADYRHRFLDANSRRYDYNLQGKFFWKHLQTEQANGQLTSGYAFSQKEASEDNPLYRLDWLGGEWADGDMEQIDLLPSAREELLRCMDMDNSYFSTARTSRHTLSLDYLYDRKLPKMGWLEIKSTLNLHREDASLRYQRFGTTYHAARHAWLAEPSASVRWRPIEGDKNGTKLSVTLKYNATNSQPNLRYMLDLTDASDPLFINLGNPDLKNMRSDRLTLQLNRSHQQGRSMNTSIDYTRWHNQVAAAQTYDSKTGVRTSQWVNINGNWQTNYNLWYNIPLNKEGSISLQARLKVGYLHSADLSFEKDEERTSTCYVGTLQTCPEISFNYAPIANSLITGGIGLDWRNVDGEREDFVRIRTTDVVYHLNAQVPLPGEIMFATNFRLTSRYGFNDALLNDTRLLWNASLSRSFRSVTLMLKGYDLLGRDRYTYINVNSQGRIEKFSNVLPRYVLLSLTWKFNKVEKKKS